MSLKFGVQKDLNKAPKILQNERLLKFTVLKIRIYVQQQQKSLKVQRQVIKRKISQYT